MTIRPVFHRIVVLVCPLLLVAVSPAAGGQEGLSLDDARFQIARDFAAMVNDGGEAAVQQFEAKYRAPERVGDRTLQERVATVRRVQDDFGRLTLTQALAAGPRAMRVSAEGTKGPPIELTFELNAVGKLEGVRLSAGGPSPGEVRPLEANERARIVEAACKALEERYVYPDVAAKMTGLGRGKLASGAYDALGDELALTRQLTEDFRSISKDRHLGVLIQGPPPLGRRDGHDLVEMAGDNYGYRKVEVLPGNIGYVRLDLFVDAPAALERATAAFAFMADVDALIVDLRHNGGGDPNAIRFITSYLFEDSVHLNDMVNRDGKVVEQYWTLKDVPGRRLKPGIPVAVLTSRHTFSGAEEFSYNLKNLKRATIIGETTGGGAHPVEHVRLTDRIVIGVPYMRARNPISRTNWEGAGVSPDIAVAADEALERAKAELRSRRGAGGGER